MKACGNCRRIWPDEYAGQCTECGAPMTGMQVNGSDDLQRRFHQQRSEGQREAGMEQALKSGRNDGLKVHDSVMEAARNLLSPKEGAFTDE